VRNGVRVLLALLPLCGWIGCPGQPGLTSGDAGFVHWIGLDSRPLAVGSQLVVTLEIATDGGLAPAYTVASSDPNVVEVEDGGNQRLLLDVRGEGSATLELQTPGERADLSVTAAIPVGLELWDAEHLAAGIGDGGLDPVFDILSSSEEVLQGVVLDARGRALNSWGLVQGSESKLKLSNREPEQFILAYLAATMDCMFQADLIDAGVPLEDGGAPPEDAGQDGGLNLDAPSSVSYQVNFVTSASAVRLLRGGPSELNVFAEALFSPDIDSPEVFGIEDWEFSCFPPDSCTMNRLSTSVVSLSIQPGTGPHDVFASSASQGLTGMVRIQP
jgi:hypothetical protein